MKNKKNQSEVLKSFVKVFPHLLFIIVILFIGATCFLDSITYPKPYFFVMGISMIYSAYSGVECVLNKKQKGV